MKRLAKFFGYAFVGFLAYATLIKPENIDHNAVNYEEPVPMELAVHEEARKIINTAEIIGRDYAWEHVRDNEVHCLRAAGLVADKLLVKYNFGEEVNFKLKAAAVKECANVAKNNGFVLVGKVFVAK